MMCQVTSMSRTFSTSRIHREVIQAKGQAGSNQKSAFVFDVMSVPTENGVRYSRFRRFRPRWEDASHAWNQPHPG